MADVFFPGCKPSATYPEASGKLAAYIKGRFGASPIGCCRVNHEKLTPADRAIVVCNNCAAIISESSKTDNIVTVYELIDEDKDFSFPDYTGEVMTVQDCWVAVEKKQVQDAVRSLLRKMHIEVVEQEENFEKTKFCGVNTLRACSEGNAKLAPRRYLERGANILRPMPYEEQIATLKEHCNKITTDKVLCYCKFCKDGIDLGGRTGVYLLNLLFGVK